MYKHIIKVIKDHIDTARGTGRTQLMLYKAVVYAGSHDAEVAVVVSNIHHAMSIRKDLESICHGCVPHNLSVVSDPNAITTMAQTTKLFIDHSVFDRKLLRMLSSLEHLSALQEES